MARGLTHQNESFLFRSYCSTGIPSQNLVLSLFLTIIMRLASFDTVQRWEMRQACCVRTRSPEKDIHVWDEKEKRKSIGFISHSQYDSGKFRILTFTVVLLFTTLYVFVTSSLQTRSCLSISAWARTRFPQQKARCAILSKRYIYFLHRFNERRPRATPATSPTSN